MSEFAAFIAGSMSGIILSIIVVRAYGVVGFIPKYGLDEDGISMSPEVQQNKYRYLHQQAEDESLETALFDGPDAPKYS